MPAISSSHRSGTSGSRAARKAATRTAIAMGTSGWAVDSDVGKRRSMEDAYCHGAVRISTSTSGDSSSSTEVAIGGVFDGHGGDSVAKYVAKNMPGRIVGSLHEQGASTPKAAAAALRAAFSSLDEELLRSKAAQLKGSTAVVALVTQHFVHIGACGDSRAVICQKNGVVQPVQDHSPHRKDEQARIRAAGGQVLYHNGCRVMGALAMSRAIGDHVLRPFGVIADPDIAHHSRMAEDEFLLLASDGLWATVSNEDVLCIIRQALAQLTALGLTRQQVMAVLPKMLTKVAMARGSSDNTTVLIMDLNSDHMARSNGSCVQAGAAAAHTVPAGGNNKNSSSCDTSAAVECIKRIIQNAAMQAWGDMVVPDQPACSPQADPAASSSKQRSSSTGADRALGCAGSLKAAKQQETSSAMEQGASGLTAAAPATTGKQLPSTLQQRSAASKHKPQLAVPQTPGCTVTTGTAAVSTSSALSDTVSVFALAASHLPQDNADEVVELVTLDDSSPFLASPFLDQKQTVLSQVWRDWSNVSQTCSCCGGNCLPGVCGCSPASAAATRAASGPGMLLINPRKRRMVTTELGCGSTAGSQDLDCTYSAPAQLQQHQHPVPATVDVALAGPALKKWAMSTVVRHQVALQALA